MTTVHVSTFISIAKTKKMPRDSFHCNVFFIVVPWSGTHDISKVCVHLMLSPQWKKRKEKKISGSVVKAPLELYFLIRKQRKPSKKSYLRVP